MLNICELLASPAGSSKTTEDEASRLHQRLGLYQVFLRIYEQNPHLLEEILNLENGGQGVGRTATTYIQGLTINQEAYLITNLTGGRSQIITPTDGVWTIGRDRQQATVTVADGRLSRCHAAIQYDARRQQFSLIDLVSTNGSFVNGELVKTAVDLRDGDRIRLGSVSFTFFANTATVSQKRVPAETLHRIQQLQEGATHQHPVSKSSTWGETPPPADSAPLEERRAAPVTQLQVEDTALFLRSPDGQPGQADGAIA